MIAGAAQYRSAEDDERCGKRKRELSCITRGPSALAEWVVREGHEPEQRETRPDEGEWYE